MKNFRRIGTIVLIVVSIVSLSLPQVYSLVMRVQAKSHINAGCVAFMSDLGAKLPSRVETFQTEFSLAALKDPAYLPIAKASDLLDADISMAISNQFVAEWRDALSTIQGLCWGVKY